MTAGEYLYEQTRARVNPELPSWAELSEEDREFFEMRANEFLVSDS